MKKAIIGLGIGLSMLIALGQSTTNPHAPQSPRAPLRAATMPIPSPSATPTPSRFPTPSPPPTPPGCNPNAWHPYAYPLAPDHAQQLQQAFDALAIGGTFQTYVWGPTSECGVFLPEWHQLTVSFPMPTAAYDPVVMQRHADAIDAMFQPSLHAADAVGLTVRWDDPEDLRHPCMWLISEGQWWNDTPSHCPTPRAARIGWFTFLPQITR